MIIDIVKVLIPATVTFFIGIGITPVIAHYLYKYKLWKKGLRQKALSGGETTISQTLESQQDKRRVPYMGGAIIWISATLTTVCVWSLAVFFPNETTEKLNFLSRNQTWLPLFTLLAASVIGLIDDLLLVSGRGGYMAGGLRLRTRITLVLFLGFVGGWWFFYKLGVSSIGIPFNGDLELGILLIPFFMIVMLAVFSGGVIDGIDGLSGGILAAIFAAYSGIAFFQNQIDIAAFSAAIAGGTLAFLWFNIPPARFYMSETGILGLTTTLAVIAFLTKTVLLLPVIAFPLFITSLSNILQLSSKKFRDGKKIFLVAPLHHHFEASGWPSYKVTMRFWVIGVVFAIMGLVLALIA